MFARHAGSHSPMHATPSKGTRAPTHLRPGHMNAESPMLDHPAGGGGMPLPQGGPGSSAGMQHEPSMSLGRAIRPMVGGTKNKGGLGGGY